MTFKRLLSIFVLTTVVPTCAFSTVSVYTDRASWNAAVQAAGLNEAGISLASGAWTSYFAMNGTTGIEGEATTQDGVLLTVANRGFELSPPSNVSVQSNTISYTEQAAHPEIDDFIDFANAPVYAFGGDFSCQTTSLSGTSSCAAGGISFFGVGGVSPGTSGFFGFVDTTGTTVELGQGIASCPIASPLPNCDAMWTASNLDFGLLAATASPEPNYLGLISLLGLGGWWMVRTRGRRTVRR